MAGILANNHKIPAASLLATCMTSCSLSCSRVVSLFSVAPLNPSPLSLFYGGYLCPHDTADSCLSSEAQTNMALLFAFLSVLISSHMAQAAIYNATFTFYGEGDQNGSKNCNSISAACGFYSSVSSQ